MKVSLPWQLVAQFILFVGAGMVADHTIITDPRWHKLTALIVSGLQMIFGVAGQMSPNAKQTQQIATLRSELATSKEETADAQK